MILAMDVGNTNIEIGILNETPNDYTIIDSIRYFTRVNITSDEFGMFLLNWFSNIGLDRKEIHSLVYSSVVPPMNGIVKRMYKKYFCGDVLVVDESINAGIVNSYRNPKEVGSDRIVNATAVHALYAKNAIVVDMGTATTIDVVTAGGNYLGGVIFPGINTASQALRDKASRLPAISIHHCTRILAEDTASAIESGVYFSNYYALDGLIRGLAGEMGWTDYVKVGTGGVTNIFKETKLFDAIDDELALKGMKVIYDINR
ncbi:MAG: type III pantothenate kinase [Spirochaetales bacterium]|nr:type III pantothenate kinase [Spirochaetales bacterium]